VAGRYKGLYFLRFIVTLSKCARQQILDDNAWVTISLQTELTADGSHRFGMLPGLIKLMN
jgi:hypothetical protein